jgi:hypothetical protein
MTTERGDMYWASMPDTQDVVREFTSRRKAYLAHLRGTSALRRSFRALNAYYGFGPAGQADTTELTNSGETGEFTEMAINEFGGLVEQAAAQLLATRAAFQAVPKSGDYAARSQAMFADKLLTAVDTDSHLEEKEGEAVLAGLLARESWVVTSWDSSAGRKVALDGERVVFEGDVRADVCLPWEVAFDPALKHKTDATWFAFRRPRPRWDVMAALAPTAADMANPERLEQLKELREAVRGVESRNDDDPSLRGFFDGNESESTDDLVFVWEVRHRPTPGLPAGRLVRFIDETTVLFDSAAEGVGYPYEGLGAEYFETGKVVGTAAGHSIAWDLLGLAEAVDSVATAMATASYASAVSNIWAQPNSNISVGAISAGGLRVIEATVKPEPLRVVEVDPAAVAFLEACRAWMQRRMGLNDVAMGDPTKGMPAQLAALLDAKVVQFWNRAVASLTRLRARVRTNVLSLYQSFANSPRVTALVGKGERFESAEWDKSKLELVSRVTVEPVSATSKTLAGKMAVADMLLERGLINTPDEYLTVKSTGRLEKLTEFKDRNLLRLQAEKEMLMQGIGLPPVDVAATEEAMALDPEAPPVFVDDGQPHILPTVVDTPWLDIAEYAAVLASPEARTKPEVVEAVTGAIQYKVQQWRTMPPEVIAALGGTPPPPPEALPGEMGPESPDLPAPEGEMRPIQPPKPPPNPLTGEQQEAPSDVTQPPLQ